VRPSERRNMGEKVVGRIKPFAASGFDSMAEMHLCLGETAPPHASAPSQYSYSGAATCRPVGTPHAGRNHQGYGQDGAQHARNRRHFALKTVLFTADISMLDVLTCSRIKIDRLRDTRASCWRMVAESTSASPRQGEWSLKARRSLADRRFSEERWPQSTSSSCFRRPNGVRGD
jgi:hypothetical protein